MEEGRYSTLQEELRVQGSSLRTTLAAAGIGGVVGVLLTAGCVIFLPLLRSHPPCPPPRGADADTGMITAVNSTSIPTSHCSTKKAVIFTEEKKNWYQALADCHKRGMIFAEISEEEEFQEVLNLIESHQKETGEAEDYWVGGSDLGHNGSFVWFSTGLEVRSSHWFHEEPTNGERCGGDREHCVELLRAYEYRMNDNCCLEDKAYVCQQWQC